ncbi:hypothetical protein SASPL_146889 [Salvia splendens]|uniref:Uncharacterized protein n=1 Tax=Salvia splendens TaxID=180675 RepID=A0A8X8WDG6_SALSN|nr:uncharacterized protein LOC121776668 [Salvia splendens]KAG6392665.1 hypothetical protein SASPL_146889 [Salvia splendens]
MERCKVRGSRSKANKAAACKKHPKHRQSPGVCSICLREKLSNLSNCGENSRSARSPSAVSSLSSYASSLSSSCASPPPELTISVAFFRKSRSMAVVVPRGRAEEADRNREKEIRIVKGGFWSKLLPQKSRGKLMHSRTTREIKGSLHHFT